MKTDNNPIIQITVKRNSQEAWTVECKGKTFINSRELNRQGCIHMLLAMVQNMPDEHQQATWHDMCSAWVEVDA